MKKLIWGIIKKVGLLALIIPAYCFFMLLDFVQVLALVLFPPQKKEPLDFEYVPLNQEKNM